MNKNPNKTTRFDGEKSNRNTKGNSKVRIKKSKLRELADKLREREDIALELIDKSLKNETVNSESVASAKWVINSIVSVEKAASSDEITNFKARAEGKRDTEEEEQSPEQIKSEMKPRLSLVYVDPDEQEDD
jgi:hypothetical protein